MHGFKASIHANLYINMRIDTTRMRLSGSWGRRPAPRPSGLFTCNYDVVRAPTSARVSGAMSAPIRHNTEPRVPWVHSLRVRYPSANPLRNSRA